MMKATWRRSVCLVEELSIIHTNRRNGRLSPCLFHNTSIRFVIVFISSSFFYSGWYNNLNFANIRTRVYNGMPLEDCNFIKISGTNISEENTQNSLFDKSIIYRRLR